MGSCTTFNLVDPTAPSSTGKKARTTNTGRTTATNTLATCGHRAPATDQSTTGGTATRLLLRESPWSNRASTFKQLSTHNLLEAFELNETNWFDQKKKKKKKKVEEKKKKKKKKKS